MDITSDCPDIVSCLINDMKTRFRVDWSHRRSEFEEAAKAGQLKYTIFDITQVYGEGDNAIGYNFILECSERTSRFLLTELYNGPTKQVLKKKKNYVEYKNFSCPDHF